MIETTDIVAWAAAFVALWWLIDWISLRQEGLRMPLRRGPLRALGDVLPKLWRNKSFMLALLCLWLIGATVAGVQVYFMRISAPPGGAQEAARQVDQSRALSDAIPSLLTQELPEALPRLLEVPLGSWAAILFAVLLIAAMVRIIIDPPEAIDTETARRLKWPVGLLVLGIAGTIVAPIILRELFDTYSRGGVTPSGATVFWSVRGVLLLSALMAPLAALLWRLILEISRDGAWSFVSSMRALAESWLPVTVVLIIAGALQPVPELWELGHESLWRGAYLTVLVLLVLTPWALVDHRTGVIAALRRSWRLFRQRPLDLIAFGLRFALLFAVLGGLVALTEPPASAVWTAWYAPLLDVVRNALLLLQAMVLARLYAHLSEELDAGEGCTDCPAAAEATGERHSL